MQRRNRLGTTLMYLPLIIPDPPSPARQLAYEQHSPLLGPNEDPQGWHSSPVVSIPGTLFGVRAVEVKVTVSPNLPRFVGGISHMHPSFSQLSLATPVSQQRACYRGSSVFV